MLRPCWSATHSSLDASLTANSPRLQHLCVWINAVECSQLEKLLHQLCVGAAYSRQSDFFCPTAVNNKKREWRQNDIKNQAERQGSSFHHQCLLEFWRIRTTAQCNTFFQARFSPGSALVLRAACRSPLNSSGPREHFGAREPMITACMFPSPPLGHVIEEDE